MKTLLGICLIFSISIPTGIGLECEKCRNMKGLTCTNSTTEKCDPSVTSCYMANLVEEIEILKFSQVQKSCATHPRICEMTYNVSVTADVYSTVMCCQGDMCNKGSLTLSPINKTVNGMRCPACFAKAGDCLPKTINCHGLQTKCFKFSGKIHNSVVFEDWTLQGCTTENLCTYPVPTYPHTALQEGYTMTCSDTV